MHKISFWTDDYECILLIISDLFVIKSADYGQEVVLYFIDYQLSIKLFFKIAKCKSFVFRF